MKKIILFLLISVTTFGQKKSEDFGYKHLAFDYKKLTVDLVDDDELERIKKFIAGRLVLGLEGSDDLAQWYARQQVLFLGQGNVQENLDTPQEYLAKVQAVTAEQIRAVAQQIFVDQGLNLAIIGQVSEQESLLAQLTFN